MLWKRVFWSVPAGQLFLPAPESQYCAEKPLHVPACAPVLTLPDTLPEGVKQVAARAFRDSIDARIGAATRPPVISLRRLGSTFANRSTVTDPSELGISR